VSPFHMFEIEKVVRLGSRKEFFSLGTFIGIVCVMGQREGFLMAVVWGTICFP